MKSNEALTGAFFTIESTDNEERTRQFEKLTQRLVNEGYDVACIQFPQYTAPSSHFVKQYQSGAYGELNDVGPYTGSVFYALDRFEAAKAIRSALAEGKIVLANRYSGSNMAHQGMKFVSPEQRRGYFIWLDNLEFEMFRIPRPERSFILRVPAELSESSDHEQQKLSVQVYDELATLFPKDFIRIDCTRDGKKIDEENIQQLLYQTIEPLLPVKTNQGSGHVELITPRPDVQKEANVKQMHRVTGLDAMQGKPAELSLIEPAEFYIPGLKGEHKTAYISTLEAICKVHNSLTKRMKETDRHLTDAVLPLATFYMSNEPVQPEPFKNKAIQQLARTELKDTLDADTARVTLTSVSPRNELETITDILYSYGSQSYKAIQNQLSNLSYAQKEKVLLAHLEQKTETPQVTGARYSFDIICDQAIFDILRLAQPDLPLSWQALTPRYGYDVPTTIDDVGLADAFQDCFDASLQLYSALQAAGYHEAATYALLRGHKFRCHFTANLAQLKNILSALSAHPSESAKLLAKDIRSELSTAHPLTATAL